MRNLEISDGNTVDYLRALKRTQGGAQSVTATGVGADKGDSAAAHGEDRRAAPRYRCAGSAEFRSEGVEYRTWATVTDISQSGCYVEIQATSPPATAVDMILDVIGVRLHVKGVVRVTYPFLGMGIAFTEISHEDRAKLNELLLRLSSSSAGTQPAPVAKATEPAFPEMAAITDATAALNTVMQFFQTNDALGRTQFLALLQKSQKTG